MEVPASPWPAADLRELLDRALEREGALLTAGEGVVCARMRALDEDAAELYARLSLREARVLRLGALRYAVRGAWPRLVEAGLATEAVPDDQAREAFDVEGLRAACARLGLPRSGARAALEERLAGRRWLAEPVGMVLHRRLLRRLERFAGMDRQLLVAERLELVRWPAYEPAGGAGLFPDRRALRAWERARAGEWTDPDEPRRLALAGPRPFGPSPFRHAVEALLAGDPGADQLAGIPGLALPRVRALEREGRLAEALSACRAGDPDPALDLALRRTGARLARSLRQPWPPTPPRREAPIRRLRLVRGSPAGARPRWGDAADPVEAAVIRVLAESGREAVHGENGLWTTLFALLFRDLYFLPIPGRLPTARRTGPLDLGTPAFYEARREAIEQRLAALAAGEGPRFAAAWQGESLDGLRLRGAEALVGEVPPAMLGAILGRLAREGWPVARGLPDLLVRPGAPVRLDAAIPPRLDGDAILVEVKGPTDSLRDEQRVWIDLLLRQGIRVEVWEVRDR